MRPAWPGLIRRHTRRPGRVRPSRAGKSPGGCKGAHPGFLCRPRVDQAESVDTFARAETVAARTGTRSRETRLFDREDHASHRPTTRHFVLHEEIWQSDGRFFEAMHVLRHAGAKRFRPARRVKSYRASHVGGEPRAASEGHGRRPHGSRASCRPVAPPGRRQPRAGSPRVRAARGRRSR